MEHEESTAFRTVVNHECRYSIWPADRDVPAGWTETGHSGTREECLTHIADTWTDMRPLGLRRRTADDASAGRRLGPATRRLVPESLRTGEIR